MFVDFASDVMPTKVISSYRLLKSPIGVVTRQKKRKCWGIALKAGGRTIYRQHGKEILSDANHIVLLPKGAGYQWTCVEQGECIVIDFDAAEEGDQIRMIEVHDNSPFLATFGRLERLTDLNNTVSRLEAMQLLYGLLLALSKSENKRYVPKDKLRLVSPAVNYMMENYADVGIRNDQLAELCGMSTVYFRKIFESLYGTSPIRYLHNLRILKAKAILSGDFDSVSQVAESVGYASVYHFSKMFKVYTGLNPSEYAKCEKNERQ